MTIVAGFGVEDLQRTEGGWMLGSPAGAVTALDRRARCRRLRVEPAPAEAFLPYPVTPISAPSNTGDSLELGLAAGAAVTTMRSVWGIPVLQDPAHVYDGYPSGRMANVELTLPGSIMVNGGGAGSPTRPATTTTSTRCSGPSTRTPATTPTSRPGSGVDTAGTSRATRSAAPRQGKAPRVPRAPAPSPTSPRPAGSTPKGSPRRWRSSTGTPRTATTPCSTEERARRTAPRRRAAAASLPRPAHRGAVPRDPHPARDARHLRRPRHRRRRPGARPGGRPVGGLSAAGNVSATVFADAYPGGGATLGSAVTRRTPSARAGHRPPLTRSTEGRTTSWPCTPSSTATRPTPRPSTPTSVAHRDYLRSLFGGTNIVVSGPLAEETGEVPAPCWSSTPPTPTRSRPCSTTASTTLSLIVGREIRRRKNPASAGRGWPRRPGKARNAGGRGRACSGRRDATAIASLRRPAASPQAPPAMVRRQPQWAARPGPSNPQPSAGREHDPSGR